MERSCTVIFRSKMDKFGVVCLGISVLFIGAVLFLPLVLFGPVTIYDITMSCVLFVILTNCMAWMSFSIKYVFYEDHLYVKGGPFRSRIRYEAITRITPTNEMLTGYRIASSKNGIEIVYKTGIWGSVKVSPEDMDGFVAETEKRCPNVIIQMNKSAN
jgi:Bacterial PH domain